MDVKSVKVDGNKMSFTITGANVEIANALRRTVIAGVPVMAIDKIRIYQNNSVLNDEMLAHRIGLIPLSTDLKTYNLKRDCTCEGEGCAKCTATLTLDAKGPGVIYSGQLNPQDPEVKPIYDNIPIIKLTENQQLKLEAVAELGYGREHIKWQGGLASYELKKDKIEFFIESYGQLPVEKLAEIALNTFKDKIAEVADKTKK